DEQDAPSRRRPRLADATGHLEDHGDARGIVIRAREELAAPDAQVVEMGRHDHPLIAQLRVGAAEQGPDVAADPGAGLVARDGLGVLALEQALELEPAELLDEIGGRLVSPGSAPT